MKLAAPYGGEVGVQDGACIIARGRAMPVTKKFGIGVKFKTIVTVGIQRDSLSPRGLETLNQVDYCVSV